MVVEPECGVEPVPVVVGARRGVVHDLLLPPPLNNGGVLLGAVLVEEVSLMQNEQRAVPEALMGGRVVAVMKVARLVCEVTVVPTVQVVVVMKVARLVGVVTVVHVREPNNKQTTW